MLLTATSSKSFFIGNWCMLSFALEERDFIYAMLAVGYLRHPQNRSGFLHFHNEEIKYESYYQGFHQKILQNALF